MDAREYLDLLRDENAIIRLAHYDNETCDGRGYAVIIDEEQQIAIMVTDCGHVQKTMIPRGAIVKFVRHPEAEPKIVGQPAIAKKFAAMVLTPNGPQSLNFG